MKELERKNGIAESRSNHIEASISMLEESMKKLESLGAFKYIDMEHDRIQVALGVCTLALKMDEMNRLT